MGFKFPFFRRKAELGSWTEASQSEGTMVDHYTIDPSNAQPPPVMITTGRDRLPIRVVDPCEEPVEAGEKALEYEHEQFLVLDTYIWVGEERRNRDVMRWSDVLGCDKFWTRAQRKGFHALVKGLKKYKPNQITGNINNNANRRLSQLEIRQIRVMPGRGNSWIFYSLSEEKPRLQKSKAAMEAEERARQNEVRRETIETLASCGVLPKGLRGVAYQLKGEVSSDSSLC